MRRAERDRRQETPDVASASSSRDRGVDWQVERGHWELVFGHEEGDRRPRVEVVVRIHVVVGD